MKKIHIIAEIANAHQGNPELALELAKKCVASGADSIKYQIYFAKEFLTKSHKRYNHFKEQQFEIKEWDVLLKETKKLGKEVYADLFGLKAYKVASKNKLDGYKVHSSDLNNTRLLVLLARGKEKIFLATGGSTILEIRYALDILIRNIGDQFFTTDSIVVSISGPSLKED